MNDNAVANLVETTFENPYNRERFLTFAKNLFHFLESKTFVYRGKYIPDAYKTHVKTLERIGKYEDQDNNKIDILAVQLKKPSSLERARTMQRNFIAWYLNGSRGNVAKDAALVAFYARGSDDWRLSLVKMDYHLAKSQSGKLKAITELTPARRFSFLVGKDENTHTAQKQLLPVLQMDEHSPKLADLENAFSVEIVTKDFFEKYKKLFLDTKEALDKIVVKDAKIKSDFAEKNIDTVDFTKKLLGQIVFLYFLQKKGWFGVARDENWGTGPKNFLRRLFEKQIIDYKNFFNNILEPLFYEALAIERPDDFYSKFNCKIPFLNGGLFDPLGNYDWIHTDIRLADNLFSNFTKTKEGDTGDGILDVFDRYNFTVKEDEPLEREVAVDPEMLGKVFENLLEVKDRKSKGTYYTPREIVHYMCQESLINCLATKSGLGIKKIESLVKPKPLTKTDYHEFRKKGGNKKHVVEGTALVLWEKEAEDLDNALRDIRICDPACGSGAFLVGMLQEIVRARKRLAFVLDKDTTEYELKRDTIQNCLYGVDIDPGAIEIAKLRLWLSLIVDEQDIKQIKPLPNLDYKIMQGNSLLEECEGIKLFDEGIVSASPLDNTKQIEEIKQKLNELQREYFRLHSAGELKGSKKQQIELELKRQNDLLKRLTETKSIKSENGSLFDQFSQAKKKSDELKKLHQEFFETAHKKEKDEFKKQIEALEWDLIETTLREQNKQSLLPEIERFKKANIKPFFLWKLNFSEVFEKNGGFDVVIGNPPWVSNDSLSTNQKKTFRDLYTYSVKSRFDLACVFVELAKEKITNPSGIICLVLPEHIWIGEYFLELRKALIEYLIQVDSLKEGIFKVVSNPASILLMRKSSSEKTIKIGKYAPGKYAPEVIEKIYALNKKSVMSDFQRDSYGRNIYPHRIYFNPGFLRLKEKILKRDNTVLLDDICVVTDGVQTANVLQKIMIDGTPENKMKYQKALRSGVDIPCRYCPPAWNNWWILKPKFTRRYRRPGFSYDSPKRMYCFEQQRKIILRQTEPTIFATLDEKQYYFPNSIFQIALKEEGYKKYEIEYILGLLNSRLLSFYYLLSSQVVGTTKPQIYINLLKSVPIVLASKAIQNKTKAVVTKIFSTTQDKNYLKNEEAQRNVRRLEGEIDLLVYKLYGLTPEEITVIEKNG